MKKQLIVYPSREMVEPCDQYYLAEAYLNLDAIHDMIKGKYTVVNYPFQSGEDYMEANKYIVNLANRIIHSYGNKLNQYKNVRLSDRQWTIVLCIWLRHFLFDIYYKYRKLDSIRNEDVYLIGIDAFPEEKSAVDFTRSCVRSVLKNAYIWTYLAKEMKIENVSGSNVNKKFSFKSEHAGLLGNRLIQAVRHPDQAVRWLGRKIFRSQVVAEETELKNIDSTVQILLVETLLPVGLEEKIALQSGGRVGCLDPYAILNVGWKIVNKYEKNLEQRRTVLESAFIPQTEFEKIAHKAVMEFLPLAYMEAFDEMYAQAVEITKDWNVNRFYSCYTSIELLDYCIALMIPQGIEINLMQHAAAYGGRPAMAIGECMYADNFLSWGWEGLHYDWLRAKVKPVAIVRQPVRATTVKATIKNKILYTPNTGEISDYGQGIVIGDYIGNSLQFIGALDKEIRCQIYIRHDPGDDFNKEFVRRCKEEYPEVNYESRYDKSFTDSALESKYIIADYYGSTHIEALCLGKAFVMFDAVKFSTKNPYFEKHIKSLRDVGIYLEDGLELAKILNHQKDDMSWMYSKDIILICDEYLKAFTRMNQNVEKIWIDEIMK